jgi:putative ATPase
MKELDYGKDYKYAHDYNDAYVPQEYLPDKLLGQKFYLPKVIGYEKTIKERMDIWEQKKHSNKKGK